MSRRLNSGGRMVRAGRNAKEILIPKISVTGLGDYTRNVGYKTGSITYEYKTHSFGYDRAIRLLPDVVDVEESGVLAALRAVISDMDERQVSTGSRYLFITPTLEGVLDDFSYANPTRSNRVLERFSRIVEVPQVRFYTASDLLSGRRRPVRLPEGGRDPRGHHGHRGRPGGLLFRECTLLRLHQAAREEGLHRLVHRGPGHH